MKQIVDVVGQQVEQETVVVSLSHKFEAHPEAYTPRVFVYSSNEYAHYELLKDGQAIPWGRSPNGCGFDFWIIDVESINGVGVHREIK